MISRRVFLKQSSVLSAAVASGPASLIARDLSIGAQLYTVRAEMDKDPVGTLKQVASIGYRQVETFLFEYTDGKLWGLKPAQLSAAIKSAGLTTPSGHYLGYSLFLNPQWTDQWKKIIEISKELGQEWAIMPWIEEPYRNDPDTFKRLVDSLNKAGELCKQNQLKLGYHGHDFEFQKFNGITGYELLITGTDPQLVSFEMDLYWVTKAGYDPIALFKQYPHRFPLWHVKDMDRSEKRYFTEVGNGMIDFKKIFSYKETAGLQQFFVEQDFCPGSPFDSLKKSYDYLTKNLLR
jgi:sugar phosphate isomerase/epimerase